MNLRKKIFSISLIFGIINIVILIFIFFYLLPALKEVSKELAITRLSLFLDDNEQSKQIQSTHEKMKKDLETAEGLFANPDIPLDIINSWEKIAEETNLSIKISPTLLEKYKNDSWEFLGFQINISGQFVDIQRFIEKVENNKYLLEINNLAILAAKKNITKGDEDQKLDEAAATILLKTYINQDAS